MSNNTNTQTDLGEKDNSDKKTRFSQELNERKGHIVHLTHNDLDAVGCDAIHRLKFDDVLTKYSSVSRFAKNLEDISRHAGKGDTLSISDIGYNSEAAQSLKRAKENGWEVEWRDHHRWTEEEINEITPLVKYLKVDTSVCATCIVRNDLLPDDRHSGQIGKIVCDYDLWKHEVPESKILGEVCTKRENLDIVRDCFVSGNLINNEILNIYRGIEEEKNAAIKKSIKHTKIMNGRYKIAFAPLYGYPSETAHAIRDLMGTDIEVIVSESGKFSVRSVPPISHLLAKKFGGGGHPPAAGGTFKFSLGDKLSFMILKKTKHYDKFFAAAEKTTAEPVE